MKKIQILFILSFVIWSNSSIAQDMLGVVNSTFAGINSLTINPALIANSRLHTDIQIFAAHGCGQNDFIYLNKSESTLIGLIKNPPENVDSMRTMFDRFNKYDNINGFSNLRINGPGLMMSIGKHSFAFSNAFRMIGMAKKVPVKIADIGFYGLDNSLYKSSDFDATAFNMSGLAFEEINFSYANVAISNGDVQLAIGATVKGLLGIAGGYFNNNNINFDYSTVDSISFDFDGEYAYCFPFDYTDSISPYNTNDFIKGKGIAFDLGFVYQKGLRSQSFSGHHSLKEQKYYGYKYKIGISLLDLGFIKYKKNAEKHVFDDASVNYTRISDISFSSINYYTRSVSYAFYNDSTSTLSDDNFSVWLPTSLSAQFDYYFSKGFYLNATIIQGIAFVDNQMRRPSIIAITPRIENKNYQIILPLSLVNYRTPQIGLAINIENVTIGTDRLAFWSKKISGMDFYVSAKIPLHKNQPTTF